ncbi:class I SAM-dependent methyltransferase [Hyalangium rubrum]|uniref:Class I SAM-dependent methyltransferase n=1 Tax=Hyalangium rubrum TaxID=3103134 RepID=A0ABU5HAD9_9BACT|nr:class I SAM-dependent methyltransferase [Hyalangium sp. s54d21]MDY7230448.1 class I SAM-dependent methyltransferase [Hyalangium sp. s54d21]
MSTAQPSPVPATSSVYDELAERIPDPRFVFMNHGYASSQGEDFSWLKSKLDFAFRYSVNLIRQTLEGVDLTGKVVLDVGCGRGGPCSYLVRYAKPKKVYGLDQSQGNIDFCRQAHRARNLRFIRGDAQALPFDDASIDVVLNVESAHYYPDLAGFYREVARVLRPGGVFCYADIVAPGEVARNQRWMRSAGLERVRSADITDDVARGIYLGSYHLHRLFFQMIDPKLGNEEAVVRLLNRITIERYAGYTQRERSYHLWRMRRP